jgi:hypothetical protein
MGKPGGRNRRHGWLGSLWRFWAAPGLTAAGSITILPTVATVPLIVAGGVVAGAASFFSTRLSRSEALQLELTQAELGVIGVLQNVFPVIENFDDPAPATSNLRACVLVFNTKGALRIAYSYGSYSRLEKEMEWREGQGVVGAVLAKKATVLAPEQVPLPSDLSGDPALWLVTDDQRRAIAGRSSTVSAFPALDQNGEVRAVILLEDRRAPADSDLRRMGIDAILERRVISRIRKELELTKFSLPAIARALED